MELVWTKQLIVEIAAIDSDHKNLIALINGIERVIIAKTLG
jgi:hemerythrin